MINKILIYLFITLLLTIVVSEGINSIKKKSFEQGVASVNEALDKANNELKELKDKKNKEIFLEDQKDKIVYVEVKGDTEIKIEKVVEYVTKEVKVPTGCESIATDVVRVRSEATSIINRVAR